MAKKAAKKTADKPVKSFLDSSPSTKKSGGGGTNYPFYLKYGTSATIIMLNSYDDPPEEQIQPVKYHEMSEDGDVKNRKRFLCLDYKTDNKENATCPACIYYNSLSKEERDELDWTLGAKVKETLPMSILVVDNSDPENIKYWKKVRWTNEYDKKFIRNKIAEYKEETGEDLDVRGLTFKAVRDEMPDSGPKPSAVGNLELPLTGFKVFDLDSLDMDTKAYTNQQVLDDHFVTDEDQIREIMKKFE